MPYSCAQLLLLPTARANREIRERVGIVARRIRMALAAVAVAVAIGGCGSDESTGTASQDTHVSPSAQRDSASGRHLQSDPVAQFTQRGGNVNPPRAKPGELLVKFKSGTSRMRIAAALPRASVASLRPFALVP